jgi:hypothetical protein
VWITHHGRFKVDAIKTVDEGRYVTVWEWARAACEWIWVADIRLPAGKTPLHKVTTSFKSYPSTLTQPG